MRHNATPIKDDGKSQGALWVGWCLTSLSVLLIGLLVALLFTVVNLDNQFIMKALISAPLGLAWGIYMIKSNREVRP